MCAQHQQQTLNNCSFSHVFFPKPAVIKSFIRDRRTKSINITGWDEMGLASSLSPPFRWQWHTDEAWQWLDQWRGTREEEEEEQRRGGAEKRRKRRFSASGFCPVFSALKWRPRVAETDMDKQKGKDEYLLSWICSETFTLKEIRRELTFQQLFLTTVKL